MSTHTQNVSQERLVQDTNALLRMLAQGGTIGGLISLDERELEALYAFGLSHYQHARWTDAMKIFSRLVMLAHGEPRYLNALASCHQMMGQHERAVHYWGVSQLLDARDPVPTFHTANSLLALGLVADALDALELVLRQCREQGGHAELAARAQALLTLIQSKAAAQAR